MRVTVVTCDGCGARIREGTLQARSGRVRVSLDVCETCAKLAVDALMGGASTAPPARLERQVSRLEEDLSRMTRIASEGYRGERDPIGALGAIVGRGT